MLGRPDVRIVESVSISYATPLTALVLMGTADAIQGDEWLMDGDINLAD